MGRCSPHLLSVSCVLLCRWILEPLSAAGKQLRAGTEEDRVSGLGAQGQAHACMAGVPRAQAHSDPSTISLSRTAVQGCRAIAVQWHSGTASHSLAPDPKTCTHGCDCPFPRRRYLGLGIIGQGETSDPWVQDSFARRAYEHIWMYIIFLIRAGPCSLATQHPERYNSRTDELLDEFAHQRGNSSRLPSGSFKFVMSCCSIRVHALVKCHQ